MEALYAMNPIKVGLDDMLYGSTHFDFGQYQTLSAALGDQKMGSAISCRKCSQVAW